MLLHTGQFGSVPNRTSHEPILLTQLTNDNCRVLRRNLARFDNDASACFDRIIVPLAMLAARRCGMSDESVRIHAETLEKMKYTVKTNYGVSRRHIFRNTRCAIIRYGSRQWCLPCGLAILGRDHHEYYGKSD
jgi:hypothetical protein